MNKSESKYFNTAIKMDMALISLLEKKEFAYITVSEICKAAGVNRSTFYLHYETMGDLLKETTQYILEDFQSQFPHKDLSAQLQQGELTELNFMTETYLRPYLAYFRENRRVFFAALHNLGTLGMDQVFQNLYRQVFDPILDRFEYPEQHRPYVMRFYLTGITAVVNLWLENGCRESEETVIAILHECIFGRDPQLLAEFSGKDGKDALDS